LASAYQQSGRPEEAETAVEKALSLGAPLENTLVIYGMSAKDRGDLESARKRLEAAVLAHPEYFVGWDQLGVVIDGMGKVDECVDTYRRAAKAVPFRRDVYSINIAIALAKAGKKKEAVDELEAARPRLLESRDPNVIAGLFYLGALHSEMGNRQQAASTFESFLRAAGNWEDPQLNRFRQEALRQLEFLRGT